jgi:hypothetical protein
MNEIHATTSRNFLTFVFHKLNLNENVEEIRNNFPSKDKGSKVSTVRGSAQKWPWTLRLAIKAKKGSGPSSIGCARLPKNVAPRSAVAQSPPPFFPISLQPTGRELQQPQAASYSSRRRHSPARSVTETETIGSFSRHSQHFDGLVVHRAVNEELRQQVSRRKCRLARVLQ